MSTQVRPIVHWNINTSIDSLKGKYFEVNDIFNLVSCPTATQINVTKQ